MTSNARLLAGPPEPRLAPPPAATASVARLTPLPRQTKPAAADMAQAKPLLLCLSHLRWDFVWQRPQHLLSRAAASHRVVVLEEPVFAGSGEARLDVSTRPGGIEIAVPRLPEPCGEEEAIAAQRRLLDAFLAEAGEGERIFWYYTPNGDGLRLSASA